MSIRGSDSAGAAVRAERARELMTGTSPAADLLGFYAALAEYQQHLVDQWDDNNDAADCSGSLLGAIDAEWVGRAVRELVAYVVSGFSRTNETTPAVVPAPLRAAAEALRDVGGEDWRALFEAYRSSPDETAARFSDAAVFALEIVVQPIAERLAAARHNGSVVPGAKSSGGTPTRCPVCGGKPVVGVLREEGHGARRRLVCGLCLTEWDYLRVVCVRCGEQRFDALPVFSAEQYPLARVEACDTCQSYLKTIDASRDGRAVPVVDDLATITLDLWAREQGYARVRTNLIRI
jgi:formate dehydrogenase accessory protein FdhE